MARKQSSARSGMESYPQKFFELMIAAQQGKGFAITLPARNFAVNMRHRWHHFRRDMIGQGVPGAEAMANLVASLRDETDGSCTLIFTNLGAALDDKNSPAERMPQPQPQQPKQPTQNEDDEFYRKIFKAEPPKRRDEGSNK